MAANAVASRGQFRSSHPAGGLELWTPGDRSHLFHTDLLLLTSATAHRSQIRVSRCPGSSHLYTKNDVDNRRVESPFSRWAPSSPNWRRLFLVLIVEATTWPHYVLDGVRSPPNQSCAPAPSPATTLPGSYGINPATKEPTFGGSNARRPKIEVLRPLFFARSPAKRVWTRCLRVGISAAASWTSPNLAAPTIQARPLFMTRLFQTQPTLHDAPTVRTREKGPR